MPGDQNSINDVWHAAFRVVPRVTGDIGVVAILSPTDLVPPDSSFVPTAVWRNYSAYAKRYDAYFSIRNRYGVPIYFQSLTELLLPAEEDDTLYFPSFNVGNDTGTWCAFCSTATGDTNPLNDTLSKWFRVGYPGIEEAMSDERGTMSVATVVRGVLVLPEARGETREARGELLDIEGRRVLALQAGANDVSGLSPGVYFVRAVSRELSAVSCQKVIIQR